MQIAVVGTGGVGGYFGGRLAQVEQDVVFLARGAHLRAIQSTACCGTDGGYKNIRQNLAPIPRPNLARVNDSRRTLLIGNSCNFRGKTHANICAGLSRILLLALSDDP
jgi:ketopantoate reductase